MKRIKRSYGIICTLAAMVLSLSVCAIPPDEQRNAGTVTITIGGSARTAAPEWLGQLELEDLVHTIQVLDKNGAEQYRKENLRYGKTSSFTLMPGFYTFQVTAFYEGEQKAAGREERTIHSGKNPAITIQMGPPTGGKTLTLTGITAVYTPDPDNAIFPDTTLDTLKEGLTVTAHYSDSTSKTLNAADYTLSGELTVGESVITVTYTEGGVTETTTFTVTVDALTHVHNWSKISETDPTCTTAGTEIWECTAITPSHHEDRPGAAALGHDAGEWHITLAATCTATGTKELRCTRDNFVLETGTIPIDPNAHDSGEWYVTQAATCIATGTREFRCTRCEAELTPPPDESATIPIDLINGHEYQDWTEITAPTCSEVGKEEAPCARDNNHEKGIRDIPLDSNAHDWGDWALNVPVDGGETKVCSRNSAHKDPRSLTVFVEGGTFQLGKEVGAASTGDVTPVSNVTLSDFYIGRNPVTLEQWQAVMGPLTGLTVPSGLVHDSRAVVSVTWYGMLAFCNRLSMAQGLIPAYRINNSTNPSAWGTVPTSNNATWNAVTIVEGSAGYRLPTEAQWEYAAKGGNPLAPGWLGYTYAGSDNPDEVAWFADNVSDQVVNPAYRPQAVEGKAPNGLGLYDMSGNVMEACWDLYGDYTAEEKTDPTGAAAGTNHVFRGGYNQGAEPTVRSIARYYIGAGSSGAAYGFRIARSAGAGLEALVSDITAAPVLRAGGPVSLTAPGILVASGNTVSEQGWQISDDGENGWDDFTDTTAAMSLNGKYLRYYATTDGGSTYYSRNTVTIKILSSTEQEVTIIMYDSYGDGWNGAGALRIVVNDTQLAAGVKAVGANSTYTFPVEAGDVVELYWVAGSSQSENSFIAYYTLTPPSPAFPANSTGWSGDNALVFRLRGTMNSIAGGELLGSFTVTVP